jgi:hypothetical protein
MKIDRIYIACHKGDFWQTKACVASIRYWYPSINIDLVIDHSNGSFSTQEIEKTFNVGRLNLKRRHFGWGFSKLELLFIPIKERFLYLDSDTLLLGPVLDFLEQSNADFIITPEKYDHPDDVFSKQNYYNLKFLLQFDTTFKYPGYFFNTGQFVGTSGIFKREDFKDIIDYTGRMPILQMPDTFAYTDQGILNYMLVKYDHNNSITLDKIEFMIWSGNHKQMSQFDLNSIMGKKGYHFLVHYAGRGKKPVRHLDRNDIYQFFLKKYFFKVPNKRIKFNTLILILEYKWFKLNVIRNLKSVLN